jgi:hypothetical protein
LIHSINANCDGIEQALIDSLYNVKNSAINHSGTLVKKINIVNASSNDTYIKIRKGLAGLGTV